jgi:hypothetical protein
MAFFRTDLGTGGQDFQDEQEWDWTEPKPEDLTTEDTESTEEI